MLKTKSIVKRKDQQDMDGILHTCVWKNYGIKCFFYTNTYSPKVWHLSPGGIFIGNYQTEFDEIFRMSSYRFGQGSSIIRRISKI